MILSWLDILGIIGVGVIFISIITFTLWFIVDGIYKLLDKIRNKRYNYKKIKINDKCPVCGYKKYLLDYYHNVFCRKCGVYYKQEFIEVIKK